ncbi:MAG: hypothetical protein Edafosvirus15_6 [Edafosvirus sp.]|uniref:Uncharacterized protein n=1 Tax=Edafosvirus sp. TaxID=2487765 RepID=A0A3G4ZUB7_9VIRU|nr:MAG: hypothetical protein Edafosvirus15_6 [Edafosvirus sp.]
MSKKCSRGQTLRRGYSRHSYTKKSGSRVKASRVSSVCIKKRGQSRPSSVRIPIDKSHFLSKFGYGLHLPMQARRSALLKAIKSSGDPLRVLRRLVALRTFRKFERTKEAGEALNYNSLDDDVKWVQKKYRAIKPSRSKSIGGAKKRGSKRKSKKSTKKRSKRSRK